MAKATLAEKRIALLVARHGAVEIPSASRKFRTFATATPGRFFFVGKAGAVRVGPSIAESISLTGAFA